MADIKNSESENRALFCGLWNIIAPKALWVNSNESAKKAACKMLQLEVAKTCGLNIPKTLISNGSRYVVGNGKMFNKKLKIFFLLICFSVPVFANPFVDVYGTDDETANKIIEKYGDVIHPLAQYASTASINNSVNYHQENLADTKKKIMEGINKLNDFHSVHISTTYYQDAQFFTTIDVIEKKDYKRLAYFQNFLEPKNKNIRIKKDKALNSLLEQWSAYENIGSALFQKGVQFDEQKECSFFHCMYDFKEENLKPYKEIFQREVPKNKQKLIQILRFDPNQQRRGHAAFLLAHIKDGTELIKILTPSLLDSSEYIRNNVMRVLGATFLRVKPTNFDILPVIKMLDSPVSTDRNKALFMLMSLSDNPIHKQYIVKNADKALMCALKMKQPNLHGNAHALLRKMSQENYGEYDYNAWQNWLAQKN